MSKPKLSGQVSEQMRLMHYCHRTEKLLAFEELKT